MELTDGDFYYLALCLQGFFFGLYSGIFAMYLQHHGSQQSTSEKAKNILFYALWVLYTLSAATSIMDMLGYFWVPEIDIEALYHLQILQYTVFACCDFIAQFILIYRCWIIWGYSIRVVIVPSLLAFAFLAIWIASGTAPVFIAQDQLYTTDWDYILNVTGVALSMTVNALVTGLIVFRILKVFRQVKTSTPNDQSLRATGGSRLLRRVIFVLIESGLALFLVQLARLVASRAIIVTTDAAYHAFELIACIHEMLNGITPTIILVRVSMGLSFHDESSMVEASIGSLRFALDDQNSIPETGSVNILDKGSRDDDIEIQLNDDSDILMVDR